MSRFSRRDVVWALAALPAGAATSSRHVEALARAVKLGGGLPEVAPGGVVVLKVNTNSGDPAPYSTSPTVVAFVAQHYVSRGVRVVVGDRSFWGDPDTKGNLERNGIAPAARAVGAEVVAFEPDTVEWTALDPAKVPHWVPPVRVPSLCFTADAVINLACAKTHFITGVTLGLKNALGFVHPDDRRRDGTLRTHHTDRIHWQYTEVHRALPIAFTIIDGFVALVAGGPTPGSGVKPVIAYTGVVLAGREAIALEEGGRQLLERHAPVR